VAFCQRREFKKALEAYSHIGNDRRTTNTWYNIALTHFYCREYEDALQCLQQSLALDADNISAIDLQGRICIEQERYQEAMDTFRRAFITSSNLKFLLWEVYALYLMSEFSPNLDDQAHKRLLHLLIKRLERIDSFTTETDGIEIKQNALYFLGCAYSRAHDFSTAIDKLTACIEKDRSSDIAHSAKKLLDHVWSNYIKPPWWRWWLQSPRFLAGTAKRVVFTLVFTLFVVMLLFFLFHPFMSMTFPGVILAPDWTVLLFVAGLLLVVIVSPSIEQIRAREIEIRIQSASPIDPFPSPAIWEGYIGAMAEEKQKWSHRSRYSSLAVA
jgi:tetratricopeptide (TPR) repeat protein